MNGSEPNVEIFKPFGEAFELMKRILFAPFDLGKWCVIGFAAFLARLSGGGGGPNFNFNSLRHQDFNWSYHSARQNVIETSHHPPGWVIPLIVIGVIMIVAIVVLFLWLGARGRFMFTDCIVRNRGAIREPWRDFRSEGNSFFLFSLLVAVVFLGVVVLLGLPIFLPLILQGDRERFGAAFIAGMVAYVTVIVLLAFAWGLISQLMVPVMYRRRYRAGAAFKESIALIMRYPGALTLYFLFFIVLAIASVIIGCFVACGTCCIAAIPYIGSVILLPVSITLYGFTLLFLRQFGSEYDVWAGIPAPPTSPPVEPPPIQV